MQPLHDSDPRRLGRYRILGRLGAGGMGQVYLGQSPGHRPVAVKTVHRELAVQPEFRERFAREVGAARRVSGAFTAPVLDADPQAELPWLATAYIPGPTLGEAVRQRGPLPEESLVVLAAGLAEALTDIHRCGLVHRDLKPANVLLAEDGPRVLDFGIARATDAAALTSTGASVGTPGYWSPEQVEGRELTPASDVFSLGALLILAATGRPAFGTGTALTLMRRVCDGEADLTGVPASLAPLIRTALAKAPEDRPGLDRFLELPESHPGARWLPGPKEEAAPPAPEPGPAGEATEERMASASHHAHAAPPGAERGASGPEQSRRLRADADRPPLFWREREERSFGGEFFAPLVLAAVPALQLPVGWTAATLWGWVSGWDFPGLLSGEGFLHVMQLGYLLVNLPAGAAFLHRLRSEPEWDAATWGAVLGTITAMAATVLLLVSTGFLFPG